MERNLFHLMKGVIAGMSGVRRRPAKSTFTPYEVLAVLLWAAVHDRPVSWAVRRENWPFPDRTRPPPASATMSRRLRAPEIEGFLRELIIALRVQGGGERVLVIDGRPLRIARHSGDPDARFGRSAGGLDNGYKLHEITDQLGNCRAFRFLPMNEAEQTVARDLIAEVTPGGAGELLADANYDSSDLYSIADEHGIMMTAQRRRRDAKGLGHRRQNPLRVRAIEAQEQEPGLLTRRRHIESCFGTQGNVTGGLGALPNHVRRLRRVRLWVTAKLAIDAAHRQRRHSNQAA